MSIAVERLVLPSQWGSNCYVVRASEQALEAAIVDPGGDLGPLNALLDGHGVNVAGILITHTDVDHIFGVAELAEATSAEVWAPAGEVVALRTGQARGGYQVRPHEPEHTVEDGDRITVAGIEFEVAGVPGHSSGHVAFHADGALFSGDLLFEDSVGRVDFEGGDWSELLDSVKRLLERFGPDTVVYSGHGGPTNLGKEIASNPFLAELR
jgi:glyoxylase-like metal-dependent hydrolase (beta-lactamase superfamily II)